MRITERLNSYATETFSALLKIDPVSLDNTYTLLRRVYLDGHSVFVCGNGGSLTTSDHFACDHGKGALYDTGMQFRVYPLTTGSLITAIANDIGYEEIFSFQLSMRAKKDDILFAISASGNSPNIIRAIEQARIMGMKTVAFVGFDGGKANNIADISLHVDSKNYGIVEDAHQSLMHILAQQLRTDFCARDNIKL
jgi:D-sedoheptulose 7-phosphate isomerase